jgi:hypothetical protein
MPDPESSSDRDEGLRRGSTFEPADERIWELPLDGADQPVAEDAGPPNRMVIVGVVLLAVIVVAAVLWLL